MSKILLYFIAFLLIPIVFVIGYLYLAMFVQADPTSPSHALFSRDLPEWLPVSLRLFLGLCLLSGLYLRPSLDTVFLRKTRKRGNNRL